MVLFFSYYQTPVDFSLLYFYHFDNTSVEDFYHQKNLQNKLYEKMIPFQPLYYNYNCAFILFVATNLHQKSLKHEPVVISGGILTMKIESDRIRQYTIDNNDLVVFD